MRRGRRGISLNCPSRCRTHRHTHGHAAPDVPRDASGKIARDPRQLNAFKKQNPCPATGKTYGPCSGYVVDHVIPLKRGGRDTPNNMQWQTTEAAREKDKWETEGACWRRYCSGSQA